MLAKTEAIVFSAVKYGDNNIILKTFTAEAGVLSFIAGGLHSKKGVISPAMIQALSILHIVYYARSKGELKRIKEVTVSEPFQQIYFDPVKSSLAMFLAEIMNHVIREEEPDPELFNYIKQSILTLDSLKEGLGSFHLRFLYQLSAYLGFKPEPPVKDAPYFDLMNGIYLRSVPDHPHYLELEETANWIVLQRSAASFEEPLQRTKTERQELLNYLIEYYRLHINDFGKLKSVEILKELLS